MFDNHLLTNHDSESKTFMEGTVFILLAINVLLLILQLFRQNSRRTSKSSACHHHHHHDGIQEQGTIMTRITTQQQQKQQHQDDNDSVIPSSSSSLNSAISSETPSAAEGSNTNKNGGQQQQQQQQQKLFLVREAVEEIHRWLFLKGGHLRGAESLVTEFCQQVTTMRLLDIPLDRFLIGGLVIHPQVSAFDWKWERNQPFTFKEVPPHVFQSAVLMEKLQNEPFIRLMQRKTDSIRITKPEQAVGSSVHKLFVSEGYTDYLALPMMHRGEFKGGMAWSTRHPGGFTDAHIEFFRRILGALSTVMRLHTNEHVVGTLLGNLHEQVKERTRELEIANASLAKANQRIQQQSNAQLKHFAMMSHEIRTPLNCIVGMSSLLLEEVTEPKSSEDEEDVSNKQRNKNTIQLDESQLESIRMITSSGNLLRAVVDDVLDYSKLEYGKIELSIQTTNLLETCKTVIRSIRSMGQERNIGVKFLYNNNNNNDTLLLPRTLQTDGRRLQQVLYNLLGNALKFSKDGGMIHFNVYTTTTTTTSAKDQQNNDDNNNNHRKQQQFLHFSIRDHGKGIKPEDIETIFRPFNQGTTKQTDAKQHGGTGLGLAITSKIVDALGGNIDVQSQVGIGAEFIVTLPYFDDDDDDENDDEHHHYYRRRMSSLSLQQESIGNEPSYRRMSSISLQESIANDVVVVSQSKGTADRKRTTTIASPASHDFPEVIKCGHSNTPYCEGTDKRIAMGDDDKNRGRKRSSKADVVIPTSYNMASKPDCMDSAATSCPLRILVAEDNVVNQKVLVRMLSRVAKQQSKEQNEHFTIDVDVVDNGAKAVDLANKKPFDLILMDLEMPIMGGLEATERIVQAASERSEQQQQQQQPIRRPQIVFLTAHVLESFRQEAQKVGGDGFISKPFTLKTIKNLMKSIVMKEKQQRVGDGCDEMTFGGINDDDDDDDNNMKAIWFHPPPHVPTATVVTTPVAA